ncbi:hypothetical protein MDOR_11380 [Mycolicibacterium doricum]|uniref:B3/B4 tRNA-binding domain-containing protein n=1 Tax=Mycolicibacterium doricum TaxID=126673 RepID=A0A7I7VP21_9MYCO|nr:phenylalanine--tRNA ligase beta subunit-related protein [Mycolicibacterium doricum]MCV7268643.1 hypothetical protein [Mycolicibacterium doricum]BBZ06969.1 hypothetical protein MDOR_11380 [Mycolicibacterium doricum]
MLLVSPDVRKLAPDVDIALVCVEGIDQSVIDGCLDERVQNLDKQLQSGKIVYDEHSPHIEAWHEIYRKFGINPRRQRPSFDALTKRACKAGALPRVFPVVDAYNYVSVLHGIPAGAYDFHKLGDEIELRLSRNGDEFLAIGTDTPEVLPDGQVVYSTGNTVMTSCWNYRDANQTKVDERTTKAVFIFESIRGVGANLRRPIADLAGILDIPQNDLDVQLVSTSTAL